ncbi:hypothetical protein B0J14DRAFT_288271 [Halenospora varia]|nr:hypothetical protein B0J14DRAFT_288271 [Halenospora varia]
MVLDIAAGVVGLLAFTAKLISLLHGLQGCGPKCRSMLSSMQTVRDVLSHVEIEYRKTLEAVRSHTISTLNISATDQTLTRCISDCTYTCRDIETILTKVHQSNLRRVKWKMNEGDLNHLNRGLEGNKGTLQLLLAAIRNVIVVFNYQLHQFPHFLQPLLRCSFKSLPREHTYSVQ